MGRSTKRERCKEKMPDIYSHFYGFQVKYISSVHKASRMIACLSSFISDCSHSHCVQYSSIFFSESHSLTSCRNEFHWQYMKILIFLLRLHDIMANISNAHFSSAGNRNGFGSLFFFFFSPFLFSHIF